MDNRILYIKNFLEGNFKQVNDFVSFYRYHNLHHWYSNNCNLSAEQKRVLDNDIKISKLHNLLLLHEWNKIKEHTKNKVVINLIKGISLSKQLFNDPLIRPTRDIDLWINYDELLLCDFLLKEIGYKRIKPEFDLNFQQLKHIHNHIHHFTYINSKNVIIELHWQLFTPKELFVDGEKVFKQLESNEITIYPNEWLLHYLIVHGALHHWFKLFWLYDVHVLISSNSINWESFWNYAYKYKNHRMINSTFYLLQNIFDTNFPFEIKKIKSVEKKIITYYLNSIIKQQNFLLLTGINRTMRTYYLSLLKPGLKFKVKTWFAPLTTLKDWKVLPLPSGMFWLYYIFRPFIWLYVNYIKKSA